MASLRSFCCAHLRKATAAKQAEAASLPVGQILRPYQQKVCMYGGLKRTQFKASSRLLLLKIMSGRAAVESPMLLFRQQWVDRGLIGTSSTRAAFYPKVGAK